MAGDTNKEEESPAQNADLLVSLAQEWDVYRSNCFTQMSERLGVFKDCRRLEDRTTFQWRSLMLAFLFYVLNVHT